MKLSGWGRFPVVETKLAKPRDEAAVRRLVTEGGVSIARGNGRSYGDSAVSPGTTIDMTRFNKMLSFDEENGILEAEAGVLLGDVIAAFLPRGWFPLVTPGTKLVTLGGAAAADVHGKNHHIDGSFGKSVVWIDVMDRTGDVHRCSKDLNSELFGWTVGGMGLTGVILRMGLQLRRVSTAWIRQTTHAAPDLKSAMDLFERHSDATYSVAWIDCMGRGDHLGRSLIMLGEHAEVSDLDTRRAKTPLISPAKRKLAVPFDFPGLALNHWSVLAFNKAYYWAGDRKKGTEIVDWDTYFYPLDAILKWNRIYGRKGFAQFQCVIPLDQAKDGLTALLATIADAGSGSFLAVLKRFGKQDSPLSFPMEGYTLALDFPMKPRTLPLLERLDRITLQHKGRFYLAKDSRMSSETLRASDARFTQFAEARKEQVMHQTFVSAQSERLAL